MVKGYPNHDPILEMGDALSSHPYSDPGSAYRRILNIVVAPDIVTPKAL